MIWYGKKGKEKCSIPQGIMLDILNVSFDVFYSTYKRGVIMVFIITLLFCIYVGLSSDTLLMGIIIGIYLGTILQLCWGKAKYETSSKERRRKMYQEIKEQDRYDNDWGIIKHKDK